MIKHFLNLSLGNALAQAIQWLSLLACIHFFSAADYGIFYAGITSIGMIGILSSLQMHQVVVVAKGNDEIDGIFCIGILGNLIVGIVAVPVATLLAWYHGWMVGFLFLGALGGILVLAGIGRIYHGWFIKNATFSLVSRSILLRAVVLSALQLALGWLGVAQGLILGALAGEIAAIAYMATRKESPSLGNILSRIDFQRLHRLIRAYDDFVVGGTLAEFISTVAFSLPVVLFSWRYTATAAGHFSLSHRLVWAPIAMIGLALVQVLYKRLSDVEPRDLPRCRVFAMLWGSVGVAMLASILLGWILPEVLKPLMKKTWVDAYAYMPPLVAWGMFFLVSAPYRVSYRILRLQKIQLMVDSMFLLWILFLFCVVALQAKSLIFCYIVAFSGIIHQSALIVPIRNRLNKIGLVHDVCAS